MSAPQKYSDEMLSEVRKLRVEGVKWSEIAETYNASESALKNAILYRDGVTGAYVPDRMPGQLLPWPSVDFSTENLQVTD